MQNTHLETLDDVVEKTSISESSPEPQIIVALEADRPLAGGARYSLAGVHEVLIGRGTERGATRQNSDGIVTLSIRVPARSLSSLHARLVRSGQQWILEDAQSRNGSFVDGQQVERAAVGDGNVLQLGHVFFLVRPAMHVGKDTPPELDARDLRMRLPGLRTLLPSLARSFDGLGRVARSRVPILLLGETGTGKELLARAIHQLAARKGAFVTVNCGSLGDASLEDQLFGSDKAGKNGALGLVRAADQGTLFLDEIGDLRDAAQAALLRVLERNEALPVRGGSESSKGDVLVVSSTHRALGELGAAPRLRQDLLARLTGHIVTLPPLRERMEDLGTVVADILTASQEPSASSLRLSASAGNALFAYEWPLNIRELQHVLVAGMALSEDSMIHLAQLPATIAASAPRSGETPLPQAGEVEASLSDEERRLRAATIAKLREHRGNVAAVARDMQKAPMQIHRWMKRFDIDPVEFRRSKKPR